MDKKQWWKSKVIWAGVVAAVIAAYNSAAPQFGWPAIPDFIYGILGALGVYGRVTATTAITK